MNTAPSRCDRGFEPGAARRRPGMRGLSLVELMVAMAIGLFLVLVATTIYLQGLSSFSFRVGQSENLGNSRQAQDVLEAALSKAGYRRNPTQAMSDAFAADAAAQANGCRFAQGQALYAVDVKTLCIRFQARDAAETDCTGAGSSLGTVAAYETPAAGTGLFSERYALADGKLVCQAGTPVQTIDMADGVRDLHFDFGVDQQTDPGAIRRVDGFSPDVPAAGETIRSLRYALLLVSSGKRLTLGMSSTVCSRWTDLGGAPQSCDTSQGPLHQLVVGTLSLRNLMP